MMCAPSRFDTKPSATCVIRFGLHTAGAEMSTSHGLLLTVFHEAAVSVKSAVAV